MTPPDWIALPRDTLARRAFLDAATCLPESLCSTSLITSDTTRYSPFHTMAPPVGETQVTQHGAEGGGISGQSEHKDGKDGKELTTAEKAALTKLRNAQRVNNLEENVHDIYHTIKKLSTSVSDIAARQDGFPELISTIIAQNLQDFLKPHSDTTRAEPATLSSRENASVESVGNQPLPPAVHKHAPQVSRPAGESQIRDSHQQHVQSGLYPILNKPEANPRQRSAPCPPTFTASQHPAHSTDFCSYNHQYGPHSRTSTPRKQQPKSQNRRPTGVNRNIDFTQAVTDHACTNSEFIDNQARLHADSLMDSLNPALPHVSGKIIFDPYTRKQALYPMPRHLLDHKSQRRVAKLECQDELSFPEFVQGFVKMVLMNDIYNPVVKAMLCHLASLSEDVTMYQWELMRVWPNTIISDIGMGRYSWTDERILESERNRAAIFASANGSPDNGQNVCVAFNQSKCHFQGSHGDSHLHLCAYCWMTWGAENNHPLHSCKKRLGPQHAGHQHRQHGNQNHNRGYKRAVNNSQSLKTAESKND